MFYLRNYAPKDFLVNGKAQPCPRFRSSRRPGREQGPAALRERRPRPRIRWASWGRPRRSSQTDGSLLDLFAPGHERDDRGRRDGRRHRHYPGRGSPPAAKYPIHDGALNLNNGIPHGLGGMLTYISVAGIVPADQGTRNQLASR